MESVIGLIREQPVACLDTVSFIDKIIMKNLKVDKTLRLCVKDIKDADNAFRVLSKYREKKISKEELIKFMSIALEEFNENSALFERPTSKMVSFIIKTMVPITLLISVFNIFLIIYLSRSISGSIRSAINLLSSQESNFDIINDNVSGELKELIDISKKRLKDDLLNLRTSKELKEIVDKQTHSLKVSNTELLSSKLFQDLMMKHNPDLLFVKNEEFKIVMANEAFLSIYPKEKRENVIGFTTLESCSDEEAKVLLAKDVEAFELGFSEAYEKITFPDGEIRTLFTQKIRFKDADGDSYILGIGKNITRQLEEEHLLSELHKIASTNNLAVNLKTQRALKLGVEYLGLSVGVISKIEGERYQIVSSFSKSIFNKIRKNSRLSETYCEHTFRSNDVESCEDVSKSKLSHHQAYIVQKQKSYIGAKIYVDDAPYGTINFTAREARETPFTNKEKSILKLLAQWVGFELTRLNSEKKLLRTNTKLQQSNDELGQFAYRTSHDLKAPLATIKGLANFIEEDVDAGDINEVKKNIKQVHRHACKLENLVIDILDLAKADLLDSPLTEINLTTFLSSIKEDLSDLILKKDVVINLNFKEGLKIWSQETRLQQIMSNLVANSIKYSDSNKKMKFVNVNVVVDKDICISVVDNGVGINEENQEKLFVMFSRFNPKLADGSGLGMYIIQKNITALGGEISVTSNEEGTRFDIRLPSIKMEQA